MWLPVHNCTLFVDRSTVLGNTFWDLHNTNIFQNNNCYTFLSVTTSMLEPLMKGRNGEQTLDNTACKAGISSVSDSWRLWLGLLPFDHVHNE